MELAKWRRPFISALRIYPFLLLALVGVAYLLGGLNPKPGSLISQELITFAGYFFMGVVPILAIVGFILIGKAGDAEFEKNAKNQGKFSYGDAFEVPSEVMHGHKLTRLTGRMPTLTGLTGDSYEAEADAICELNPEHTPPVANCECGFYAFQNLSDAKFELSINPGTFLIDVDLYGLGFVYQRGYRAETQVVNHLTLPKRCMRCRILTPKVFVASFHLGHTNHTWWQWSVRCQVCSASFKPSDKLTFEEMAKQLKIVIS